MATLDVAARHADRFEVLALTAQRRLDELFEQCAALSAALRGGRDWRRRRRAGGPPALKRRFAPRSSTAQSALCELAAHPDVDIVMAAIVGAAGLAPCLAAARAGKRLLLANKEALVVGGALFIDAVRRGGATLLPIDSEHSAIFQCLPEDRASVAGADRPHRPDRLGRAVSRPGRRPRLGNVTPDEACAHPNWVMGRKISVDSATMMNKALEVIEAHWLFDLAPEQIRVVIHPQSIIHSMVVCRDQSVLAQLGTPDMRVPIAFGLAWPERIASGGDVARLAAPRCAYLRGRRPRDLSRPGPRLAGPARTGRVERGAQCRQRGGRRRVSRGNHRLRSDSQGQPGHGGIACPRSRCRRVARLPARSRRRGAPARPRFREGRIAMTPARRLPPAASKDAA